MRRLPDCTTIDADDLPGAAARLHGEGWRFVTASCVPRPLGAQTVLYHFERGERLCHLRVELPRGGAVPSIGGVFAGAFLVENEMGELQGLSVTGLAIDYGGRLYRDFDRLEGLVHRPGGGTVSLAALETAGAMRLDACAPVVGDEEVRAPTSRVPAPPGRTAQGAVSEAER